MVSLNSGMAAGLKGERETVVCEHNVAGHVDKFSTPAMISLMERAAIAAVAAYLEEGQTTVGFEVQVRHLGPSEMGARVRAEAELVEVSRNRLSFAVAGFEGEGRGGEGTHRRAVIERSG